MSDLTYEKLRDIMKQFPAPGQHMFNPLMLFRALGRDIYDAPPPLDWSDPKGTHLTSFLKRTSRVAPRLSKKEAIKTPPAFRELLLKLATQLQSDPEAT